MTKTAEEILNDINNAEWDSNGDKLYSYEQCLVAMEKCKGQDKPSSMVVDFDGPFTVGANKVEWVASLRNFPGMVCSGETKAKAWQELIKSVQVKMAYDSGISSGELSELITNL